MINEKPLSVNIIITEKDGKPMIELRKSIYDPDIIKIIITHAFRDMPITIYPQFNNRIESINSLIKKGIIYREGNEYLFLY